VDLKGIGKRIRDRRKHLGMTQRDLAELLNTTRGNLAHYEIGDVDFTVTTLEALSRALHCKTAYLLGQDRYDADAGPAFTVYLNGLPPDVQDDVEAMVKVLWERRQRELTTYGRKADDVEDESEASPA
jgi:transcriptional regulator with XRE-family HTH domain